MPQPPTVPQVPVLTFYDPNKRDRGLVEYWSTETAAYTALDLGTPHPNSREYPGFRLGIQAAVPNNFGWIRRVYVTDETNPDWFNAQEKFSLESTTHPIFIRSYREEKKTYVPRTKLTPLGTVVKVTVTDAGTGYTPGTYPGLTFTGGGGSGVTGHAIVAANGTIAELVLDDGGSGYTTAPTFTVDDPPSGTTATGAAFIQPQTALLVAEEAQEYPTDSEFFGLFFNVLRVYETLPGPIITTKTIGQPNLTPEKYRRLVRTEETNQPVPATYTFPPGLTGDQTEIELAQETIAKARLKIISEIIAIAGDAIIGGETDPFGALTIYETVVNEGTPIDEGFLVVKSSVTPFGNGKAVKITVRYPIDLALRELVSKTLGQDNLIPEKYRRLVRHQVTNSYVDSNLYIFPLKLYGDESQIEYIEETLQRARLKIVEEVIDNISALVGQDLDEYGALTITETIVDDGTAIDQGFLILKSTVTPLGNGKSIKITVTYPLDLALIHLLDHSLGQPNLTPAKYRRMVRQDTTRQKVDPSAYIFPTTLTGNQTQIQYIQETITRARLETLDEVITNTTSLIGAEGDEFGPLRITETIVAEGTAIDQGFLIKHSSVTPFGNGKSVKITAIYTNSLVAAVDVRNGGVGGTNGVHTNGSFTGGGGSGATFTYTVTGGVVQDTIVVTNPGTGYIATPTAVMPQAGSGVVVATYLGGPPLLSLLYDEEMQVHYREYKQIVMTGTPASPDQDGVSEETKAIDIWRSLRIRTYKTPTATSSGSAIISYEFRPYKFPGTLDVTFCVPSNAWLGARLPKADLVKTKVKTWWEFSSTTPDVDVDEIITETVVVDGIDRLERFPDVLHDAFSTFAFNVSQFYPATTPSFSQYYNGTQGGTTRRSVIAMYAPGDGGYSVGDTLSISGSGDSAVLKVVATQYGGYIGAVEILDDGANGTYSNPVTASGGHGSGAQFNVFTFEVPTYIPGTAWRGTERVIAASVTPEKQKNLWKIQTYSVVMR